MASYTLDDVCDAYNDLMDLKSYALVLKRSDFPDRLLAAPCLGTLLVDVGPDGRASSCCFEPGPSASAPLQPGSAAYAWVNIERADWPSPLHSNCLLWWAGEVWRFEPHGADPSLPEHAACGFQNFYDAAAFDVAVSRALDSAGLLRGAAYRGADARWPVLGQSCSTNDGRLNVRPLVPGRAFKRSGAVDGRGDNYCGAWTLLFLARALAPGSSPAAASDELAADGGAAADLIAAFIVRARAEYAVDVARMLADADWAALG